MLKLLLCLVGRWVNLPYCMLINSVKCWKCSCVLHTNRYRMTSEVLLIVSPPAHAHTPFSLSHTHTQAHSFLWSVDYVHVRLVAVASYPRNYVLIEAFPHLYQLRPLLWCVYNCVCICTCLCLWVHMCTCMHTYMYIHMHATRVYTQVMHTYQCTLVHRYVYVYTCIYCTVSVHFLAIA